ncbi:MAG: hypothetical protein KGL62_05375, partial [Bradyrhizobium sp.]|nr:hypothetical protein [Bradyrhizobium sp.]
MWRIHRPFTQSTKPEGTGDISEHRASPTVVGEGNANVQGDIMTNRLMISVAVFALMAGTGLANAQGGGMGREAPSATQPGGATSEHGTSGGQINHDAARPEMKSTQSEA